MKPYFLITLIVMLLGTATAKAQPTISPVIPKSTSEDFYQTNSVSAKSFYCPPVHALTKANNYWEAGNLWKSDAEATSQKIVQFIGAQWIGINIGKIVCLYKEENRFSFPIALIPVHPMLVLEPSTSFWVKTKEDYRQCISNNIYDCPFSLKENLDNRDPYQQIEYHPLVKPPSPFEE